MIRKAQPADYPQLAQIFLDARRQVFPWQIPVLSDFEQQTAGEIIYVAVEKKPVGFISIWEPDRFIHHLYVAPQHQRCGIGKQLLDSLRQWLPLPYQLKCVAKNELARAFYTKHGWREISRGTSADGEYIILEYRL
ncbi:MAG: hypothetical protein PCFJNLEI_01439 [Verrucomicrobiae bacterium]|nr:hypothetical protein [Verrucomicrobiae bacterium]